MNAATPHNDDDAIHEALQRDAARVLEPPFNAALHHATMRRIRALAEPGAQGPRFHLLPTLTTAVAALTLAALLVVWWPHTSPKSESTTAFTPSAGAPRCSLLAYQTAADKDDDTLLATLDRDARELLPASSPAFTNALQ